MPRFNAHLLSNALVGLLACLAASITAPAAAAPATSANSGHVQVELVADAAAIAPGATVHVALRQVILPGWHTYWRNPGDSGEATTLAWALPPGWRAGEIVWPAPKKLPIGPLMDYGYEGEVLLPSALAAPGSVGTGQTVTLKARADYLVCKDICVPEGADLTLSLPVTAAASPDPTWAGPIAAALAAAPKPGGLKAALTPGASLKLSITGDAVKGGDFPNAYFFPYDSAIIDHAQPQAIERGPDGLTLSLAPGSAFKSGRPPGQVAGVLSLGARTIEIDAAVAPALPGAAGLGQPVQARPAAAQASQIVGALAAAFLGGLILNLMPCVFPILSMKAMALTRHAHGPSPAMHGVAFMGGVIATFLGLAAALIAARAAGQAVGWGFQLQSAPVVAGLALVLLLAALNLSGVFEVGESLQALAGEAGNARGGEGLAASGLTGVLAVAVAAPCTAPFMAGAIGFAFTQAAVVALAIFFALGLGLAAPFTALSFAPGLLRRLPRPGAWMGTLKGVLAFPMYAAAAWLVWVFSQQSGTLGLAALLAAVVLAGFAAWLYGRAQRARIVGRTSWAQFAAAGIAMLAAATLALWPRPTPPPSSSAAGPSISAGVESEPFSPDRLAAFRAAGKPVFVNFTAAWCVTCQVNDRVALSGPAVADAFRRADMAYLVGDWTNRDAVIAQALAQHGRAGVPLYLVYPANGGDPVVLPQILTPGIVLDAVKTAAKR